MLHSRRRRTRGGPARHFPSGRGPLRAWLGDVRGLVRAAVVLPAALGVLTPGCTDVPDRARAAAHPGADSTRAESTSADSTPANSTRAVRDAMGREVRLARPARRVISLIPAQTEVVKRLAGADVLVARTVWDDDPQLAHLPSTGNALSPSVEWLAAQRPELVIAWPDQQSRNVVVQLAAMGIGVYASAVETLADVDTMIARLGALLGREAAADSLRAQLHAELDSVRASVAGRPRPRAYYALSLDPPMAATGETYIGELLELAGAENIFPALAAPWAQVSLEEILRRDPEVIIRPLEEPRGETLAQLRALPGWRDVTAVRAGRVHEVDADLLNRPGASLGRAARVLAAALHPGAQRP